MPSYQEKTLPATITVPSSSSYLNIDTRDQLKYDADGYIENAYQNPFDISIYKPDTIFQGRILRIALTNFNMLWSCPNVNPYNNVLYIEWLSPPTGELQVHRLFDDKLLDEFGAVDPGQDLPIGFYNGDELAARVQLALNAGSGVADTKTWLCTYNNANSTFTISPQSSLAFRINPMFGKSKGSYTLPNVTGNPSYLRTATLAQIMGFSNASKSMGINAISDTASLSFTSYVDIVSSELTNYQYIRDFSTSVKTGRNLIARLFLGKNMQNLNNQTTNWNVGTPDEIVGESYQNQLPSRPFTINYEPINPKFIKWDQRTFLSGLNIKILDEFGNILFDDVRTNAVAGNLTTNAGSSSYCQMTFTVTEGDN